MYYKTRGQSPAPDKLLPWDLAERFHWTLDYIDSLPASKIHEYSQIRDAKNKAGIK